MRVFFPSQSALHATPSFCLRQPQILETCHHILITTGWLQISGTATQELQLANVAAHCAGELRSRQPAGARSPVVEEWEDKASEPGVLKHLLLK